MQSSPSKELEQRLIAITSQSEWFMSLLWSVRELGLQSWCIGAGAVRNLVWDALHERTEPSALADVDVAYFDASVQSPEHNQQLQAELSERRPDVPWEVTNQAAVHRWFESYFGYPVEPLLSLEDAVGSWPEYATSVGLFLDERGTMRVIAPHGLDDLFGLVVRRNPRRASVGTFWQRVEQKRYTQRWPRVRVVCC